MMVFFLAGWLTGVLAEYGLHWSMHRWTMGFHIRHHKEFFQLPPRDVALNTLDVRLNLYFFAGLLVLLSPLMAWLGWQPVVAFWAGAFWHLVIVYEGCHALMHHDPWLPRFVSRSRVFRWWKGCHFAHHQQAPSGNYCVTIPLVDWCLGTYVRPGEKAIDA